MKAFPLIIDTNLLVLYVVGTASREYISKHKRLTKFMPEDYDLLRDFIFQAPAVFVTPNTLTETSNLAAQIAEPARSEVFQAFQKIIRSVSETFVASSIACERQEFLRLGLADSVLIETASQEAILLTADFNLYHSVLAKGARAENFNYLREQYWENN